MESKDLILGRQATEEEVKLIEEIQLLLDTQGLSLLGILPKPRPKQ